MEVDVTLRQGEVFWFVLDVDGKQVQVAIKRTGDDQVVISSSHEEIELGYIDPE